MQENVSGFRVVKAYVKEDYEKERFGKSNDDLVNTQLNVLMIFSYMQPIMNIILNLSVVAVIKVGGIQVANGSVTPGNVMAAITYVTQSLNAVMRMTNMFQTASRGIASGRRINEVLACEPSIKDGSFNATTSIKGKIEFKNVTFAYPLTGDKKILDNINLVINPGETIGILGETGCGKTSLINLMYAKEACLLMILMSGNITLRICVSVYLLHSRKVKYSKALLKRTSGGVVKMQLIPILQMQLLSHRLWNSSVLQQTDLILL